MEVIQCGARGEHVTSHVTLEYKSEHEPARIQRHRMAAQTASDQLQILNYVTSTRVNAGGSPVKLSILTKPLADDNLKYFYYFSKKICFDISRKLSYEMLEPIFWEN